MCGIAGVTSATPLSQFHHEQLLRMNGALIPRGPDGSDLYQGSHVALAMRRLSIIDLSNGWHTSQWLRGVRARYSESVQQC